MARRARASQPGPRLGKQLPRYRFFLNPYTDVRFTTCPQCQGKTSQRKLPLVIHIDPLQLVSLNKTCRYCPRCDLLIAHRDELEAWLAAAAFREHRPEIVGNDYLVLGTEDRADWLTGVRTTRSPQEAFECLHDFRDVVRFTPPQRWARE
jgi:Zn-finger nucleic acid-binding protein